MIKGLFPESAVGFSGNGPFVLQMIRKLFAVFIPDKSGAPL